jgi:LmbE family N-acetylglucosaminyl deacetylase
MRPASRKTRAALAAAMLAAIAATTTAGMAAAPDCDGARVIPGGTALPRIDADTTLLVVAPHPDDETLCCGGLMQRVLRAGGRVSVVWITSGDAGRRDQRLLDRLLLRAPAARARQLGEQRMAEARAATAVLGVPPDGQLFLGYPDGGLSTLLDDDRARPYTSPSTAVAQVPYAGALYLHHPYTGASLERDFANVLERVRPTLIVAPSPLDSHADHAAAGRLTMAVAARGAAAAQLRYWIVHGGEGWPSPRGLMPGVPLTAPPRASGLAFAPFVLEPAEEDRKRAALADYRTQMQVMEPFLLAFVRTTELFAGLPEPPDAQRQQLR